jgi:hypothetical protein
MTLRVISTLALACCLLIGAGCGPEPDTLPRRAIDARDQRWAEGAGLRAEDLGAPWRGNEPEERAGKRATSCSVIDYSDLTLTAEASGDSLFDGDRLVALSAVQVYASEREARAAVERGASDDAVDCTVHAFRVSITKIDEGFDLSEIAGREAEQPDAGSAARHFELVLDFEVRGERVPGFFDIYVIQRGRAVVALFLGGAERFPANLAERAVDLVDARLRADPPPPRA